MEELLPPDAFLDLPASDGEKFIRLCDIAKLRLKEFLGGHYGSDGEGADYDIECRWHFMALAQDLSKELNIGGVEVPNSGNIRDFLWFLRSLERAYSVIRLQSAATVPPQESVRLGYKTVGWLRQEAEQLRIYIDQAGLPEWKSKALHRKLDELLAEINAGRVSYAKMMAMAASIAGIFGGAAAGVANMPKALDSVHRMIAWLGHDQEAEEAERERLAGPTLALPSIMFPSLGEHKQLSIALPPSGYVTKLQEPDPSDIDEVPF